MDDKELARQINQAREYYRSLPREMRDWIDYKIKVVNQNMDRLRKSDPSKYPTGGGTSHWADSIPFDEDGRYKI